MRHLARVDVSRRPRASHQLRRAAGGPPKYMSCRGFSPILTPQWLHDSPPEMAVESSIGAVTLETGSSWGRRLSPQRRCLNPSHRSVSDSRSSNRTCSFPASGAPTGFTPDSHSRPHDPRFQTEHAELTNDVLRPKSSRASRRHLVPSSEKVLHGVCDVVVDGAIGQHPRTIPKVRGPASESPIEVGRHLRPSCVIPRA